MSIEVEVCEVCVEGTRGIRVYNDDDSAEDKIWQLYEQWYHEGDVGDVIRWIIKMLDYDAEEVDMWDSGI